MLAAAVGRVLDSALFFYCGQISVMNTSGAFFRAHLRWPTSEEAVQDRSTTIRRGSVKTRSRFRRDAAAAAFSLRMRRFAGRLAKPFAGEKRPALAMAPCSSQDSECDRRAAIFRTNDFANHPSGASPKRGIRAQRGQAAEQRCFCARPLRDGEADSLASLVVGNGVRKEHGRLLYPDIFGCTLGGYD
ncbi:MAG: hypothetical protein H0Z34_13730 [Brevibacillus sp.]|nr:hypothetical protein [Brevibacillus sp.]